VNVANFCGSAVPSSAVRPARHHARHASSPGNRLKAKPMADGQGEAGGYSVVLKGRLGYEYFTGVYLVG